MSIPGELERARNLAYAAAEDSARALLVSLVAEIERADRDDWLLEVFAQLGEIYLTRGAFDGTAECARRITDCVARYRVHTSDLDVARLICRYTRRADYLDAGLAAARGDHDRAETALVTLVESGSGDDVFPDLLAEHAELITRARVRCATALAEDDLYARAHMLWHNVIDTLGDLPPGLSGDHVFVTAATEYGRFCIETGRLAEAEPWLARAGARAQAHGWELAVARAALERAAASWSAGDHESTEQLITAAYPTIAQHARAHDVSRCWLYFGLTRLAVGLLEEADECWQQAERHWRELGAPLHIHRILLQRSWIAIFTGDYDGALALIESAREFLEQAPRRSWVQMARLDSHLGNVWRADALADLGFDAADPEALGTIDEPAGTARYESAMVKLEQAADLKIPAALAVDSVRYTITDTGARAHWATRVAAPLLASAFAVAWEWENTELTSQLIEYHSARGMLAAAAPAAAGGEWSAIATESVTIDEVDGPIELGPLPTLQMDPGSRPILIRYRTLAQQRYGTPLTADLPGWTTWP